MSETQLEALLRGSIQLAQLREQLATLKAENAELRARMDRMNELPAPSMFHRPQAT